MLDNSYNKTFGKNSEELACKYLKKLGYKIVEKNYLIRGGEVDIIALDQGVLVFVEFKARANSEYGSAVEAITLWKIKALKKSALFYIQKIKWGDKPYRFDLVAIDYLGEVPKIELVRNITM